MRLRLLPWIIVAAVCSPAFSAPSYPKPVKKELYGKDLRGKQAPTLYAAKWLTAAPNTKGKIVVIDFWATWCPPCRETIPELGEWQKKFAKDIVVIGVSDETEDVVRNFMKKTSMPYTVGVDASGKMKSVVGVKGIPHILVITPDNVVRWQGFPLADEEPLTPQILQQIIDAWKSGAK